MPDFKLRDPDNDSIYLADDVELIFGSGVDINDASAGDLTMKWDGTDFDITQTTANSSIKWGVSGAGIDMVWYGDTATYDMTWDQSADTLLFNDNAKLTFGTGSDIVMAWDGTDFDVTQATANSSIKWGVDGAGIDHVFYGDTASVSMTWDQSADTLLLNDNAKLTFGTGSDIVIAWDGTDLDITQATANSSIKWGVDGAGIDHVFYGDTASATLTWDQSADALIAAGAASIRYLSTTITDPGDAGAIPVTHSGYCPLVTAGAETRTLAAPSFVGQEILMSLKTDGGNCVVTCATTFNEAGNNTATFADVGDSLRLSAVEEDSNLRWRCAVADGHTLTTV